MSDAPANQSPSATPGDSPPRFLCEQLPTLIEQLVPSFLPGQRWYGEKGRDLRTLSTQPITLQPLGTHWLALVLLDLDFSDGGDSARYFLPLLITREELPGRKIGDANDGQGTSWHLFDAPTTAPFQAWLPESASHQHVIVAEDGRNFSWTVRKTAQLALAANQPSRLLSGEQSNSNIIYGQQAIAKVFRRVQPGLNPDVELGRFLTETIGSQSTPSLLADWTTGSGSSGRSSLGLIQELMPNIGDGWSWLLDQMHRAATQPEIVAQLVDASALLGKRTAEIHLALAAGTTPDLIPIPITPEQAISWQNAALTALTKTRAMLETANRSDLDQRTVRLIDLFLTSDEQLRAELGYFSDLTGLMQTRVHGDYHLGQTLRTPDGDWVVLDFEGEPARSLAERRSRQSPLKDVAGMLRSFAYARAFVLQSGEDGWSDETRQLDRSFVSAYRATIARSQTTPQIIPVNDAVFERALRPWVIEKAIYEIAYERNNRPDWLWAPLAALFANDQH